jgi:hypothetical protein
MRTCSQVTVHVEASPRGDLRPRCRHTDLVVHPRVRAGRMARRRPALFRGMSRTSCRAGRGSARLSSPTAVREFSFRTAPSRRTRLDHVVLPLRAAGDRTDVTESYEVVKLPPRPLLAPRPAPTASPHGHAPTPALDAQGDQADRRSRRRRRPGSTAVLRWEPHGAHLEGQTKGNTTNKSPEPQDLQDTSSWNPPKSNLRPCNP